MRFFVTGATGFIGGHLCRHLVSSGHEVLALVRNPKKANHLPNNHLEVLQGDLRSFRKKGFVIPACDQVIHLAGTITANRIQDYERDNFEAVVDLFNCLKQQNWLPKRLLFASSQAAAGPSPVDRSLTEADIPNPIDPYGQAKLKAELFLQSQTEIPVSIFRPPTVIGPYDTNVLHLFKVAKTGFGFTAGSKKQPLSFVAVSDLVNAIELLIHDRSRSHRLYFVSGEETTDTHALWQAVAKTLGRGIRILRVPFPVLRAVVKTNTVFANTFKKANTLDIKYYLQLKAEAWLCSSRLIQNDFGWQPQQSLAEVLAATAESYKLAGWI